MAAYSEVLNILKHSSAGLHLREVSAEVTLVL